MTLKPHIRTILERTRAARAEINQLVGVKRAKQIEAEATAQAMARWKAPKLEDPQSDGEADDPAADPAPAVDGVDPQEVPARQRGNARRRSSRP